MAEHVQYISGILLFSAVYFAPMAVAFYRDLPAKGDITVLNIFFGWSGIGWLIGLAWALMGQKYHGTDTCEVHRS